MTRINYAIELDYFEWPVYRAALTSYIDECDRQMADGVTEPYSWHKEKAIKMLSEQPNYFESSAYYPPGEGPS